MKVVATRKGFYGIGDKSKIINIGEQFEYALKEGEQLPSWVEAVEVVEPKKTKEKV